MTKQNSFKSRAPSDKPRGFDRKPNSYNRQNGGFNKGYNNRGRDFASRNQDRKPFNRSHGDNKNRPIRKQFNPRNQRDQRENKNKNNRSDYTARRPYNNSQQRPDNRRNDRYQNNDRNQRYQNNDRRPPIDQLKQQQRSNAKKQQQQVQPVPLTAEQIKKQKEKRIKHNRIIIRNLVFDVHESHLRKLLSPFGQILDIHIPQNPDGKGSRGFAFVQFGNRNHALKAIKDLNGTSYKGRTIVLDQSVSKQRFLQSKVNEQEKQKDDLQVQNKKKEQKSKVKLEQGSKKEQNKIQEEENQDNDEDAEEQNDDQQDLQEEDQQNEAQVQTKKQHNFVRKQKTQEELKADISSQVFIRNLPINVDEKALHQFFRRYGQLKFAKIVINKETGLSKGSAFLKFQDPLKAKELSDYSRNYEMNLLGKYPHFKVNPAINLQLEGTILKLFPVQTRTNVQQKIKGRDEKDRKREQAKKDEKKKKPIKKVRNLDKLVQYDPNNKRNLKLALLGINQITEDMREKDQERFRNHEKEKIEKLKNPNNSVSDKRIVLKFLDKEITEQEIRTLCLEYLEESQKRANDLTYCKLMLESLQTKKSAGFAFVEFKTHEISLGFLEWIAEQPSKLMKEPFVCQFAIQDSRKLMKLQNRNSSKGKDGQNQDNSNTAAKGNNNKNNKNQKKRGNSNKKQQKGGNKKR